MLQCLGLIAIRSGIQAVHLWWQQGCFAVAKHSVWNASVYEATRSSQHLIDAKCWIWESTQHPLIAQDICFVPVCTSMCMPQLLVFCPFFFFSIIMRWRRLTSFGPVQLWWKCTGVCDARCVHHREHSIQADCMLSWEHWFECCSATYTVLSQKSHQELGSRVYKVKSESGNKELINLQVGEHTC